MANRTAERDSMWRLSEDLLLVLSTDGVVKAASPSVQRVLGVLPTELVGRRANDWLHPDELPGSEQRLAEVLERPVRAVNRMRTTGGDYRQISWRAVESGRNVYAVGRDVTDELKSAAALEAAEAALRQSQKMEAIGNLTGGIAHDFNNLLQTISVGLQLIQRRPTDPTQVKEWAKRSLDSVARGSKLTSQLLTFSRTQTLKLQSIDVSALLGDMADMLARTIGPTVRFCFDIASTQGLSATADATQLELAIVNLCINARDAMPNGGDLTISTRACAAWPDAGLPAGDFIEVSVIDTGDGMTPDVLKRAFDPFFTTKGVGHGTGLGLSQVYGFTHQAGGRVRIESSVGQGTTVRILLRQAETLAENTRPDVSVSVAQVCAADVLLVDDEDSVRELSAELLRSLGYSVRTAANASACLAELDARLPDLLITDFAMPGMNGAELAVRARERHPKLRLIFLTGYADSSELRRAVGEDGTVLAKPIQVDQLVSAIEEKLKSA